MNAFGFSVLGFFLGSIPFSVWLGRLALRTDIRSYGADQNPGTVNAWRAGKWQIGLPVLLLDFFKAAMPVGIAQFQFGISGWELVPVALAPVVGHAFSPFLRFHGGKALATTFGIWTGLTLAWAPLVLGACFAIFYSILTPSAWAVVSGMLCLLVYLLLSRAGIVLIAIWIGNMLVLLWRHRRELRSPIRTRPLTAQH